MKVKWETDLELQITDMDWEKILAHISAISRNARIKLINFYYLHRVYLTTGRINSFYAAAIAACPIYGELGAEMFHMVWSCLSLAGYWKEAVGCVNDVTQWVIPCTPLAFLLGGYPCPTK